MLDKNDSNDSSAMAAIELFLIMTFEHDYAMYLISEMVCVACHYTDNECKGRVKAKEGAARHRERMKLEREEADSRPKLPEGIPAGNIVSKCPIGEC